MMVTNKSLIATEYTEYLSSKNLNPLFIHGDASEVLKELPSDTIDFCMTSPPYWGLRQYHNGGIGLESECEDYIRNLLEVFAEVKRVLKSSGSFWLNMGDTYVDKSLLGLPWRVAFRMMEEQDWILRNSVIWNKIKGGLDNSRDRLGNIHETVFHFVQQSHDYYYDADSIRTKPRQAKVVNGAIVSATGVSGVRYRRQIELSTELTEQEKNLAFEALDSMLQQVAQGEVADFRMVIRGVQRVTHSDSTVLSGRAKELQDKGFYFLKYHPKGSKPSDVWDILPESTQRRGSHSAPYPEDLCKIPILASCPEDGVVLDPFCGTGTTMSVALLTGRKSVGIDISHKYLTEAQKRCNRLL